MLLNHEIWTSFQNQKSDGKIKNRSRANMTFTKLRGKIGYSFFIINHVIRKLDTFL